MNPKQMILSPREQAEANKRDAITVAFEAEQARWAAEREAFAAAASRKTDGLRSVRFLQMHVGQNWNNAGEVAGVDPIEAERLVKLGIATFDLEEPAPAPVVEEAAEPVASPAVVAVRFLRSVAPYAAGEVAGFPEPVAAEYIKHGWAERAALGSPARRMLDAVARIARRK